MSNSMHSMSSLFKTSSCKFKDPEKKIFLVDSAKKTWFIIVVSMVAGMIRELSTLQNLLCGQGGKTERKKLSFMIKLVSFQQQHDAYVEQLQNILGTLCKLRQQ